MTTTVQVRTKKNLKKDVQAVLASLGIDLSTAINMYFVQIVQKGGIPFPILTENGMTPEAEQKILDELEEAKKYGKVYASAEEMHAAILADDEE